MSISCLTMFFSEVESGKRKLKSWANLKFKCTKAGRCWRKDADALDYCGGVKEELSGC